MRWCIYVVWVLFAMSACVEQKSDAGTTPTVSMATDESAIRSVIHGFFRWYEKEASTLASFDFVDESGPYRKLEQSALQQYFNHLHSSGFISQRLVEAEKKFYHNCEAFWKTERKEESPSCLSADRFYCAFDYIAPYYSGEVKSIIDGAEAVATLTLTGAMGEQRILVFNLIKENNQWLLSGLGCDMHSH